MYENSPITAVLRSSARERERTHGAPVNENVSVQSFSRPSKRSSQLLRHCLMPKLKRRDQRNWTGPPLFPVDMFINVMCTNLNEVLLHMRLI